MPPLAASCGTTVRAKAAIARKPVSRSVKSGSLVDSDIDADEYYLMRMPDQPELLGELDQAIEHSPLERDVTRDGTTVRVFIYRGRQDPGWLLEIEDERGGSTVWEDFFDNEQAALDEALRTIDEDGIHSFAQDNAGTSGRALWDQTIAQPAIAELRRTLASSRAMTGFHRVCGMFAALGSVPQARQPSEWLEMIKADHVFEGVDDVQRFASGVMALYSEVLRSVQACGAHCCPPAEDHDAVREFCAGYWSIAGEDPTWSEDERAFAGLVPIRVLAGAASSAQRSELEEGVRADPEEWLQHAREKLAENVVSLHGYWSDARTATAARLQQQLLPHRRATPKIGRNERCPCGSGKKFKKCCAQ